MFIQRNVFSQCELSMDLFLKLHMPFMQSGRSVGLMRIIRCIELESAGYCLDPEFHSHQWATTTTHVQRRR